MNGEPSRIVVKVVGDTLDEIKRQMAERGYSAANELRNASLHVLRGQRSGRTYRVPGTRRHYTASAPGEAPAVRTGVFRNSWQNRVTNGENGGEYQVKSTIESGLTVGAYVLGELLEDGTGRMKSRPYKAAVKERAMSKIIAIYKKSYNV